MTELKTGHLISNSLSASDDGFIMLGSDGYCIACNDEATRMLDLTRSDIENKPFTASITDNDPAWNTLISELGNGKRTDLKMRTKGGRHLLVSLRKAPKENFISLVQLSDLDGLDYRRKRLNGDIQLSSVGGFISNNTRPDYAEQRRLCSELHRVLSRGERAMRQGARLLITGETGVGKTEIARHIHGFVSDASDPFVVVNCATQSTQELMLNLFGDGTDNPGLIHKAKGGTLFLDEVAELSLQVQARLVGYLEDSSRGLNGFEASSLPSLRIISATNTDLHQKVTDSQFRADLFYRLAVVKIDVPPLRQMPTLINHLADRFLRTLNQRRTTPVILPERFRQILNDYSFPGNIRELLNIVQRAAVFMEDAEDMEELTAELIENPSADGRRFEAATMDLKTEVRRFERDLIDKAILLHGSKRKAAQALGVDIGTISRKTKTNSPSGDESEQSEEKTKNYK